MSVSKPHLTQAAADLNALRLFVATAADHNLADHYEATVTIGFMRGLYERNQELERIAMRDELRIEGLEEQYAAVVRDRDYWEGQARNRAFRNAQARVVELEEQYGTLHAAARALLESADDQTHPDDGFPIEEWLNLVDAVRGPNPATIRDTGITLDFARGEVRHGERNPAKEPDA